MTLPVAPMEKALTDLLDATIKFGMWAHHSAARAEYAPPLLDAINHAKVLLAEINSTETTNHG